MRTHAKYHLIFIGILILGFIQPVSAQMVQGLLPRVLLYESCMLPPGESAVEWSGDVDHFKPESGLHGYTFRLSGNSTCSDTSWLAAPISLMHGEWTYTIKLDSDPSQSNRIDLVLWSDSSDFSKPFNGYIIKAGENGANDVFRLMRVDNGQFVNLISGTLNIASGGVYHVHAKRQPTGKWELWNAAENDDLTLEGTATDDVYELSNYTGFRTIYTRTRYQDYAVGPITISRYPPDVVKSTFDRESIVAEFDTFMDVNHLPLASLHGSNGLLLSKWFSPTLLHITRDEPFPSGHLNLSVSNLRSEDGLFEDAETTFSVQKEIDVNPGDIIINEYMYYPPENVPQFVELYNRTDDAVNLKNWELRDFSTGSRVITTSDYWLDPQSLLVLTPDTSALISYYNAQYVLMMARFPFLNRGSKDGIILIDNKGTRIDSLAYSPTSDGDGVSIERISVDVETSIPENWIPSTAIRGATPGLPNSADRPTVTPTIQSHRLDRNRILRIKFRGSMKRNDEASIGFPATENIPTLEYPAPDSLIIKYETSLKANQVYSWTFRSFRDVFDNLMRDTTISMTIDARHDVHLKSTVVLAADTIEFRFSHNFSAPHLNLITIDQAIFRVVEHWKTDQSLKVRIEPPLILNDQYDAQVSLSGVVDVDQKPISIESIPLSRIPKPGDLLINEIMFNPLQARFDGGLDQSHYVEVYNNRPYSLFLPGITLETSSLSSSSNTTHHFDYNEAETIGPYKYYIYKPDTTTIQNSRLSQFFGLIDSTNYYKVDRTTLGFNSTAGSVWIKHPQNGKIDSVFYADFLHQPSVRDRRGISLERISPSLSSTDHKNWGSHAGLLGGTPGWLNSITTSTSSNNEAVLVSSPNPFSPDGDTREDITAIQLTLPSPGWLVQLRIYDRYGRFIRSLTVGERVGRDSTHLWNGLDENGRVVLTGIYIALAECWNVETRQKIVSKVAIGLIHQTM